MVDNEVMAVEEEVVVEAAETEEAIEEKVEKAEKPTKSKKASKKKSDELDDFIARKLVAINRMENKAKAKVLAQRVLNNRKEK